MNSFLLIIPIISAISGWTLTFLFAKYFLQNYLPEKQKVLSLQAGEVAAKYFSENLGIQKKISDPALLDKAMPAIERHIDEFLNVKLQKEIPMLSMFVGNKTTDKIKEIFIVQVKELFPNIMADLLGNTTADKKIEEKISQKLSDINIYQWVIKNRSSDLQKFYLLGLLAGFIIGSINLVFIYLIH